MEIISCLGDNFNDIENEEAFLTAVDSSDPVVAYHAIKKLANIDYEKAREISQEILKNYKTQPAAKINIAVNVIADGFKTKTVSRGLDDANLADFLEFCSEIYDARDDLEVQSAIEFALEDFPQLSDANLFTPMRANSLSSQAGYAAYRNGVAFGEEHVAIIISGVNTAATLVQASGSPYSTDRVTYNQFLNGMDENDDNESQGYFRPRSQALSATQRGQICSVANQIANYHIPYILSKMIDFNTVPSSTTKFTPSMISHIRCDGVVEYCYEYLDIRVIGNSSDSRWNVSINNPSNQSFHNSILYTPSTQLNDWMTRIGSFE